MKNYLEQLAEEIRQEVPTDLFPDQDTSLLFLIYAVLARAKGAQVEATDVHDAWAAWMTYESAMQHPSIRQFAELSAEVQAEDAPFLEAIRRAVQRRSDGANSTG